MNRYRRLIKILEFLLVGIFIALVFTITPGTYSLYAKEYNGPTTKIEAGATKDFIKNMRVEYNNKGLPSLRLERADDIDYSPVIFFSIEGDLKDYVLHMDSVKLEKILNIPIVPNINLPQAISLILSPKKEIVGKLKIKHLNEFINETLEVSISKEYLLERYFLNRGVGSFKISSLSSRDKDEMGKFVEKMISDTNVYMDWDRIIWKEDEYRVQENGSKSMPIGKVNISSNQVTIIDLVAPDLLNYNNKLYSLMEVLVGDLNNYIAENNILKAEKEKLVKELIDLEDNLAKLKDQIIKLKADNNRLDDEIRYLKIDSDELYEVRRDFRIENGDLYNYIRDLEDELRSKGMGD